jgi:predicted Zn finger-like uncharacterized protein
MALATQCPHCHTTFRVAHDQLKLRAGLVRCGTCKQIFNGIENLLQAEVLEQAKKNMSAAPEQDSPDTESRAPESFELPGDPSPPIEREPVRQEATEDTLLGMTLIDFTQSQQEQVEGDDTGAAVDAEPDRLEQTIDDLQHKPLRRKTSEADSADADELDQADSDAEELDQTDSEDDEEPSFVRQGRRKQRIGRVLRLFMASASIILLVSLFAQSAYVFRNQLAAWLPQTSQTLAEMCAYLGCKVGLPAQIDSVSIESSELQTLAADSNTFTLTALLRNHGATEQAWPNIELTLNDSNEKAIARRVFAPRDYLPSAQDARKGFGAKSEQSIKLFFQVSQLSASGYRVYLFYP